MKRLAKWIAIGIAALSLLLLLAVATVLVLGRRALEHRYDVAVAAPDVRTDSAAVARGAHLADVLGCAGCHGDGLEGRVFAEDPLFGRLVAPNLTGARARYDDADFDRLLRHGVRPDSTGVSLAMPSASFARLADDDLAAIIAYVRSLPAVDNPLPDTRLGLFMKAMLVLGRLPLAPTIIDHEQPGPDTYPRQSGPALGKYLARVACSECHGLDLRGNQEFLVTPDLAIAASYSREQFTEFMRTGVARGDRELNVMSGVTRGRFSHFSDGEIAALHEYFTARATGDTAAQQ
jgi:mono/diheme cytochrome c family protein